MSQVIEDAEAYARAVDQVAKATQAGDPLIVYSRSGSNIHLLQAKGSAGDRASVVAAIIQKDPDAVKHALMILKANAMTPPDEWDDEE